jgi:hypothetical protein
MHDFLATDRVEWLRIVHQNHATAEAIVTGMSAFWQILVNPLTVSNRSHADIRRSNCREFPTSGHATSGAPQTSDGVALYPTIMPALAPWAEKLGVAAYEMVLNRSRKSTVVHRKRRWRSILLIGLDRATLTRARFTSPEWWTVRTP